MSKQGPIEQELSDLAVLIGRLQRGELTRPEFRRHNVHFGVTQRQPALQICRGPQHFAQYCPLASSDSVKARRLIPRERIFRRAVFFHDSRQGISHKGYTP